MDKSACDQNFDFCRAVLNAHDKDRYLANLLVPQAYRPYLHALYAFSSDIARVREIVSSPIPGEMRYQWWRDALMKIGPGNVNTHPLASAMLATIEHFQLPVSSLLDLIDARTFDLYDDPMPSLHDLEGYCGETTSILFHLSCFILNDGKNISSSNASGHAGVAYAITGLMRALPYHAARGQIYLPADLMEKHHVQHDDIYTGTVTPALLSLLKELRDMTRFHLAQAQDAIKELPSHIRSAFTSLALVEPYLQRMDRPDYNPFQHRIDLPQWRQQWVLWRGF